MCGRTTHLYTWKEIWDLYQVIGTVPAAELAPDYNVPPTRAIPAVRMDDGVKQGGLLRWGLVPFWAKGVAPKYSTINARVETVETAASYRGPWKRGQRCILPISGFYEWQILDDGKSKQPFYITCADQAIFGLAGLWDHNGEGANKHRMPAILALEDSDAWLAGGVDEARLALKQYPADLMSAYPVSTRVNKPQNNGPELLEQHRGQPAAAPPDLGA
jgi:putative SOS response-associated peptidase YedK